MNIEPATNPEALHSANQSRLADIDEMRSISVVPL